MRPGAPPAHERAAMHRRGDRSADDQNEANGPEDHMSEQQNTNAGTTTNSAAADAAAATPASPMAKAMSNAYASTSDPMTKEGMSWCVLRVASNKETSVRDTLLRKVQIEKMEHLVSRILVPTEKTKTIKGGKQKVTETKLYPGYVFVEMKLEDDKRIPQDVFFLIKETTGVGDFVGTKGFPTPMKPVEIEKMLAASLRVDEQPQIKLVFEKGEAVTIKEGPFQGYEGTVDELIPEKGLVRVLVTIFGRQAPVELEEWQIGKTDEQ
jgi:transcriptional antiterminator NusG